MTVSGCAAQRQAKFDAAAAQCKASIPAQIGSFAARTTCINTAAEQAGFRSPAQELINATNLELAEKVDRGEITLADAKVKSAQVSYDVNQQAAAAQAQQAAAAATILSAMPRPQPYVIPTYQMPVNRPWTANCTQMGSYTTCNGN